MTDRRTDRRTDGGDCNIPDAFLKKRGDNKQILIDSLTCCKEVKTMSMILYIYFKNTFLLFFLASNVDGSHWNCLIEM